MRPITGKLYDGKSSKGLDATITADGAISADSYLHAGGTRCVIYLEIDGKKQLIPAENISISSRLGQTARYINIVDFGKFETLSLLYGA